MENGNSSNTSSRDRLHNHNHLPFLSNTSIQNGMSRSVPMNERIHNSMTLGQAQEAGTRLIHNNLHSVINELGPLMHHARTAETHSLNLRSWLRRPHHVNRSTTASTPLLPSDSTIIDFDNISQPSTSQSGPIHDRQPNRTNFQLLHQSSMNENSTQENFVNEQQETNQSNVNNVTPNSETENSQAVNINAETQSVINVFQRYAPFILILLGKAMYDHRAGILIFLGLMVTFTHADSVVKREIAKQGHRSLMSLFILFVNLFVCICFIYYVFQEQHLYKSLILIPPYSQPINFWDLLWIVGITDFVLKFITIQIKAGIACFPAWILPYSARGKWYLLLECLSQFYRGLAPIQPWLYYLHESYQGSEKIIAVFLTGAYISSKGTDLLRKVRLLKQAVWKLIQNVNLGVSPSKEQLDTAGSTCPICHDEYNTPVLLHCKHVFCESCVTTWFDREQTCPLCRAKIADDPSWRDGATTFFAQLF